MNLSLVIGHLSFVIGHLSLVGYAHRGSGYSRGGAEGKKDAPLISPLQTAEKTGPDFGKYSRKGGEGKCGAQI